MKFMKHNLFIVALFLFLLFIILFNIYYLTYYANFNILDIEMVVSRYNEDLQWLKTNPFDNYPAVIYNKGPNDNIDKTIKNITKIVKIKNVGREAHTYLYHIIENYYNLAEITLFLPGSIPNGHKYNKAKVLIENIEIHRDTVFVGSKRTDMKGDEYGTTLNSWDATDPTNNDINSEHALKPSSIRPFGKWVEEHFPNVISTTTSGFSIIGIARRDIIQHPIEYYKKIIKELENSSNPETGHYFERAWFAVFYPYKNLKHVSSHW